MTGRSTACPGRPTRPGWPGRSRGRGRCADPHGPGRRPALCVDVTDGRFADTEPVFTGDGLYLAFLSRRSFDPVYDAQSFDLSFPFGSRPYLVPLAAATPSPFGPRAGRPRVSTEPPDEDGSDQPGRRWTPTACRSAWSRPGGRGALLRPAGGQGRPGLAARPGDAACSARAAPSRTTTGRARRWSGSTCASGRSPSWPRNSTGSPSAATAPGWSSRTTASCGSCRPRASADDTERDRSPSTCPGPGSPPIRRRCGGTPTPRPGGSCAGTSGSRTCPGSTGTACWTPTGRCWTGSAARPTSPTCCGRCSARRAPRTRTWPRPRTTPPAHAGGRAARRGPVP